MRVVLARYEMQHRDEQDADRPAEIDRLPQVIMLEDLPGAADIPVQDRYTVPVAG